MKKRILIAVLAVIYAMIMTGCSSAKDNSSSEAIITSNTSSELSQSQIEQSSSAEFVEENGVLTYLDTTSCPFEDTGFRITADTASKTVKFVKTDLDGKDTLEYYTFDYNLNTVEQYYYVSMMGTGFYYTYDLNTEEIVKIEDKDHNDTTQSTKDNGRYDSANERLKADITTIEEYFSEKFGKQISDIVKD